MRLTFVLLLLSVWIPAVAHPPAQESKGITVKKEARYTADRQLLDLDAHRLNAMVNVDETFLKALLADDLTYTHSNGMVQDKADLLEALTSGAIDYRKLEPRDVKVRFYANTTAIVTGVADATVVAGSRTIQTSLRYTAVYIHDGEDWRMVAYHSAPAGEKSKP